MTKRIAAIAIAALILPALAIAGNCNPDFAEHGTFEYGGEEGCWLFVGDGGKVFQTIGGNTALYREGLSGVITGQMNYELSTTCTKGPILEMCTVNADNAVTLVGVLEQVEGGCWVLNTPDAIMMVVSANHEMYVEGAKVVITGLEIDVRPYCAVDGTIEVLSYQVFGIDLRGDNGSNAPHLTATNAGAACHAEYAQCSRSCRSDACVNACELLFDDCMTKF